VSGHYALPRWLKASAPLRMVNEGLVGMRCVKRLLWVETGTWLESALVENRL